MFYGIPLVDFLSTGGHYGDPFAPVPCAGAALGLDLGLRALRGAADREPGALSPRRAGQLQARR